MVAPYRWNRTRGFTLVELLVVVAIIALLISILLPSLAAAREQARKIKCLANEGQLGRASNIYANDDESENIFPMHHKATISPGVGSGIPGQAGWYYLIGDRQWGGKGGDPRLFNSEISNKAGNAWAFTGAFGFGIADRPLNRILYKNISGEEWPNPAPNPGTNWNATNINLTPQLDMAIRENAQEMDFFRCPSDRGITPDTAGQYYQNNGYVRKDRGWDFGTSGYEFFGNSYYGPMQWLDGGQLGFFSTTAFGTSLGNIQNPSRMVLFYEGNMEDTMFFNRPDQIGSAFTNANQAKNWWSQGYHQPNNEIQGMTVVKCDGSADTAVLKVRSGYTSWQAGDEEGTSFTSGTVEIRGSKPEILDSVPYGWANNQTSGLYNANKNNMGWWGDKMFRIENAAFDNLPRNPTWVRP